MKLSRTWAVIGGGFLAATIAMPFINEKIKEEQSESLRKKFDSGEIGITIQLPVLTSSELSIRQVVWREGKNVIINDSRVRGKQAVMPCNQSELQFAVEQLRAKLSNSDSMSLDEKRITLASFSVAAAGQVVCGFVKYKELKPSSNYGILFGNILIPK